MCDVGNRTQMMPHVVKLYIHIFEFLHEAMCWYQSKSKRLKSYLNENYHARRFQPLTTNIRKTIADIRDQATMVTYQRINYLADTVGRIQSNRIASDDIRYGAPVVVELRIQGQLEGFKKIGEGSTKTLCAVGEQFFHGIYWASQVSKNGMPY